MCMYIFLSWMLTSVPLIAILIIICFIFIVFVIVLFSILQLEIFASTDIIAIFAESTVSYFPKVKKVYLMAGWLRRVRQGWNSREEKQMSWEIML